MRLCIGNAYIAGAQIIFPESGRGLDHATATIFGSTIGYPSDSLAPCYKDATVDSTMALVRTVNNIR